MTVMAFGLPVRTTGARMGGGEREGKGRGGRKKEGRYRKGDKAKEGEEGKRNGWEGRGRWW